MLLLKPTSKVHLQPLGSRLDRVTDKLSASTERMRQRSNGLREQW
jgi:hypothetical protein